MFGYRLVISVAAPLIGVWLLWRLIRRQERPHDLNERLGCGGTHRDGCIWLHGASNGELTSARPLIEALRERFPHWPILVTSNTATGRDLVKNWALSGVSASLAPIDLRWAVNRFRKRTNPVAMLCMENEIWPNRIATSTEPVILVAARISQGAAKNWTRFAALSRSIAQKIALVTPQDVRSGERLRKLGVPDGKIGPVTNLKSLVQLAAPDGAELSELAPIFPKQDTILAASTHQGEDEIILSAYQSALKQRPDLKLVLAPRHIHRAEAIETLLAKTSLKWARRSTKQKPQPDTQVLLADTMGEMPLWYSLASATVVAGSFSEVGGHTPFEPIHFENAVIHGLNVSNFSDVYAELDGSGGALCVTDEPELAEAMVRLGDGQIRAQVVQAAREVIAAGTAQDGITAIIAFLSEELGG